MALGTPVAGAAAYSASGGTTVSPAYPAGILATDVVLLFVGQKPSTANGGTVTTPAGWTLREELLAAGGYGATLGADTGNTNLRVYSWGSPVAGQTGTRSVTLGTNNISWAFIVRIPTGGGAISYNSSDGQKTAAGAAVSITVAANPGFQTGDKAIWAMCIPTDVTTPGQFSAHAITATGATFATATELNEPDSSVGNDIGGFSAYAHVDSGTATVAPTITATAGGTTTNVRGPLVLVRVRETQAVSFDAEVGSYSITGQAATTAASRSFNAEAGAYSLTGQAATLALSKELSANSGSYAISGQAANFTQAKALLADAGSYVISGQLASLIRSTDFSADAGTYLVTGQPATLSRAANFSADVGAYAVTGQPASFFTTLLFSADSGTYSITGQAAGFQYVTAAAFDAESGSYVLAGQNASVLWEHIFASGFGQYAISEDYVDPGYSEPGYTSSSSAALLRSLLFNSEVGSYSISGQPAGLSLASLLNAEVGSYSISGQDVSLLSTRFSSADAGSYVIGGQAAGLIFGSIFNAAAGAYVVSGQPATLTTITLFPNPADVRDGVIYGPGGIYVGTLKVGGKILFIFDD